MKNANRKTTRGSTNKSNGKEKARFIRAESEKNKTVLLAEAQRDSDILRGQGDAEKNKILEKPLVKIQISLLFTGLCKLTAEP